MEDKAFWTWVHEHEHDDSAKLILNASGKTADIDIRRAVVQIQARQKFGKKLKDTLEQFSDFYFPALLNGEQSTSDLLATYHASLINKGVSLVDLTSGLGIDAMHFAARAADVVAVEQNSELTDALKYNAKGLGISNIDVVNSTCEDFLGVCEADGKHFDVAFIDPARRGSDGQRLYALEDCSPDVVGLMPLIAKVAARLIMKVSPMLDISSIIASSPVKPRRIIACGTTTECKELIVEIDFSKSAETTVIEAVTLPDKPSITFTMEEERECPLPPLCGAPIEGGKVYEPYPTVMKTGAFRILGRQYGLQMFQPNTRVLYSRDIVSEFPGTIYEILKVLPYASRVIKRFAKEYPQINVAVRNFGLSADALRAKLGVRDGGDKRLYAVTDHRGECLLLVCKAI